MRITLGYWSLVYMIKTIKWWLIYSVRNFLVLVGFWLVIQPVLNDDDDDDDDGEITKK